MTEREIVRRLLRRIMAGLPAASARARALLDWPELLAAIEGNASDGTMPHVLLLAERLAALLALEPFHAALLQLVIACDRLPRVAALAKLSGTQSHDLPALLGELAGAGAHDADRAVRRSALLRLGLAGFRANRQGEVEVDVRWTLERLLDHAPFDDEAMLGTLVGARQPARLDVADFAHIVDVDFLVCLLRGADAARAAGINILIHGPPRHRQDRASPHAGRGGRAGAPRRWRGGRRWRGADPVGSRQRTPPRPARTGAHRRRGAAV